MKGRSLLAGLVSATIVQAHPHLPHPKAAPAEGTIATVADAQKLPAEAVLAVVDGRHHPEHAKEILKVLASRANLRELQIYGATKWGPDSLAGLEKFKQLEVLRIYDDSTKRKPQFFNDIQKVQSLKVLKLYYSGD